MKRILILICIFWSAAAFAQNGVFDFLEKFNWDVNQQDFLEIYSSEILSNTDSTLLSVNNEGKGKVYQINDYQLNDVTFKTVVAFGDELSLLFIHSMTTKTSAVLVDMVSQKYGQPRFTMKVEKDLIAGVFPEDAQAGQLNMWPSDNAVISTMDVTYDGQTRFVISAKKDAMPRVQRSFFGLTVGNRVTTEMIRKAFAGNGTELPESDYRYYKYISFSDVYFAGTKWDMCTVMVSDDQLFYGIGFSCLFNSYSKSKDDIKLFNQLKANLDEKYRAGQEIGVNNIVYEDITSMKVSLSLSDSESARILSLGYFDLDTVTQIKQKEAMEL